jgi:hypothetical protein
MDTETLERLRDANLRAAKALQAGTVLANRSIARAGGAEVPAMPDSGAMGALLASPAAFWATAAVDGAGSGDTVSALVEANKYAAARAALGDMSHVREGLLGQATWLGVQAVRFTMFAEGKQPDQAIAFYKLALAAQRQAAQTLASVAALNKLADADAVAVMVS